MKKIAFYPYEEASWTVEQLIKQGAKNVKIEQKDMLVITADVPCVEYADITEFIGLLADGSWWAVSRNPDCHA